MSIDATQFHSNSFFKQFDDGEAEKVLACGVINRFSTGDSVFLEGDTANAFYLVLSGEVSIEIQNKEGLGEVVGILKAGEFFGESSLFLDDQSRSASAFVTRDAYVFALSRSGLDLLVTERPTTACALLLRLLETTHERLRTATYRASH